MHMDERVSVVEQNLRAAMACYERVSDSGETCNYPGIVVTSCGHNISVFNSALLSGRVDREQLSTAVSHANFHFQQRKLGWSLWICDDLVAGQLAPEIRGQMHREGLMIVAHPPGMYTESLPAEVAPPPNVEFRKIEASQGRLEFAHVSSVVFALPYSAALRIYGQERVWSGPMSGWLAYVRNKPAAIVTVVVAAEAAGVYSLGTLPQYRRQGIGGALLRHALEQTRK
ncbi:MAG TPA: GNAT family N-acetyltransferase, partial [Bryobacteraceae bacterium]|nr:GNAT family N-acetyltransferase [Bryobacteraceae bacterium]